MLFVKCHSFEELNIANGTPVVNAVTVLINTDEGMSRGKRGKIRKQYSVHCDGKENLRVADSPQLPRRKTGTSGENARDVEVDSAMTNSEHYSYPRSPGDNVLSSHGVSKVLPHGVSKVLPHGVNKVLPHSVNKVLPPADIHLNAVKVPYRKAYSHPPHQDRNILSLDVDEPPPSAPPGLQPSAPVVSPQPKRSLYVHPEPVLYAEPNNPGVQPPPLPAEYVRRRFGDEQPRSIVSPGYHQTSGSDPSKLYPTLSKELQDADSKTQKLSGTDSDDIVQIDRPAATAQRCGVQTRNVKINTDTFHYANYSADPKSKSWLMRIKKTFGKSGSKKKIKVNVERENTPQRPCPTTPSTSAPDTSHRISPSVVRTRAEVTAHLMTTQPSAPRPTPEPEAVQYEPDNKPSKQPELYPPLPPSQPTPPPPANLSPSQINTQIFGTHPAVPFPNGGVLPNVPFMWFPYGVPQPQAAGHAGIPISTQQGPLPPSVPQLPHSENQTLNRMSKRKKVPDSNEHDCIDPTLLSQDLIRHVKRSCGLNSSRSRTAARAIIQCLEDSVSDTLKIQLLSELLTAMDTPYRARREEEQERGRRKRTRTLLDDDGREVVRNHTCKRALKEERILMNYLQQVLEILEDMSEQTDKENNTFHMYFNLANRLLETMYNKVANKPAAYDAS